jgi:hypothetical protein
MSEVRIRFEKEKETKNTVCFAETVADGEPLAVGTLYVQKFALKELGKAREALKEVERTLLEEARERAAAASARAFERACEMWLERLNAVLTQPRAPNCSQGPRRKAPTSAPTGR